MISLTPKEDQAMTTLPDRPAWKRPSAKSDQAPERYARLTEAERWRHHTRIYAHRIVYQGFSERQHWWEGDPIPEEDRDVPGRPQQGKYFNAEMIAAEVVRLEARKARQDGSAHRRYSAGNDPRNDPIIQAQRAAWIKLKGHPSWEACLDAMWRDAIAHAHPDNGEPDVLGALRRSGFRAFCADWGQRLIRARQARQGEPAISTAAE